MVRVYRYSRRSKTKLSECHSLLQDLFNEAIKHYDITIVCGYRDEETQNNYFNRRVSTLTYPNSKHNKFPSEGVDFAVYHKVGGVSYNEKDMLVVAGVIEGLAISMGIPIRCGFKWDNQYPSENGFLDIGHIELDSSKLIDPNDIEYYR